MNLINVGIDLDGVIFNFSKRFSEYCNYKFGERCPIISDRYEIKNWNWEEWYPITKEESKIIWNDIKCSKNFWQTLKLINNNEFDAIRKAFNNYETNIVTYFITSRIPTVGNNLHLQCINSLIQYHWKNPQVILSNEKGNICRELGINYFIDDKVENCLDAKNKNENCNVYIMDAGYNKHLMNNNIKRITSLYSFLDDIKKDKNYKGQKI